MKNKKLKAALSITGYFLLLIALCFTAGLVFHSYYYTSIYVSGASMMPTLYGQADEKEGSVVDFGIIDTHSSALKHLKRFDIVSTYYSNDYDANNNLLKTANKKIKRIIALPGEEFKIENGELSVKEGDTFVKYAYPCKIETTSKKDYASEKPLGENEYWVLGDNRNHSTDSGDYGPIKKEYIVGRLIAIEGRATIYIKNYTCKSCYTINKDNKVCSKPGCGSTMFTPNYDLKNKVYHWPKYF